jgi:folylpolyglutamate synthase/dihydropteroate synthase
MTYEDPYVFKIIEGAKAHFLSQYVQDNDINTLLAVVEDDDIDNIFQDLKTFLSGTDVSVLKYPHDDEQEQIITLSKIIGGKKKIIAANKESVNMSVVSVFFNVKFDNLNQRSLHDMKMSIRLSK